jgi:hypothetical protein
MGTTRSRSTDSPAPSPTNAKIDIDTIIDTVVSIAVLTVVDTNAKIDIDTVIDTAIGIAVLTVIDTNAKIDIDTTIDIAGSTVIDTASPSTTDLTPVATIIDPTSGAAGAVSTVTGGFDMAFGLFNFHVDNYGAVDLISISDSAPLVAETNTPPAVGGKPPAIVLLAPSKEGSELITLTPSVGSNDFKDPPLSPTTAYSVDCNAYHYMGIGDFSSHEIAGCEDPQGGTVAIYPMISECERALNALTLRTALYDSNYVEELYSDYTCSDDDDDVYPEAKGKIGNSASSYSSKSATSSNGYTVDYDPDFMIEVGSYIGDDDIYPPALGEISDDSTSSFGGHCMMASHGDGNEHRSNDGRNWSNTGR